VLHKARSTTNVRFGRNAISHCFYFVSHEHGSDKHNAANSHFGAVPALKLTFIIIVGRHQVDGTIRRHRNVVYDRFPAYIAPTSTGHKDLTGAVPTL
jgi:hypothetical protein